MVREIKPDWLTNQKLWKNKIIQVDFTEDQVEDIKDGFDLYDRTGEGKLFFNQVILATVKWLDHPNLGWWPYPWFGIQAN